MIEYANTILTKCDTLVALDLDALTNLMTQLYGYRVAVGRAHLETAMQIGHVVLFRHNHGSPIVGTGQLTYVPSLGMSPAIIGDFVVHRDHQKRGIGTLLLDRLVAHAKQLGAQQLLAMSNPGRADRAAAIAFYKRHGFNEVPSRLFGKAL